MQRPRAALVSAWGYITSLNKRSNFHPIEDDQWKLGSAGPGATELQPLSSPPSYAQFRESDKWKSRALPFRKNRKIFQRGWRSGAINCAFSVTIVFLFNLIVTAWGTTRKEGKEIIFEDECHRINKLNTWLHLLVNLLSTILLSASNYCMQCLSAPTRGEVDKAHAKGLWLDIGVLSMRNLRFINKRRALLWALLCLSSLPLHLFYNSIVYSSIASHDYLAINVPEAFMRDRECLNCDKMPYQNYSGNIISHAQEIVIDMHRQARNDGDLKNLTSKDCINEYAKMIQSFRRHVLLVGSDDSFPPADADRTSDDGRSLFNNTRVYDLSIFASRRALSGIDAGDSYDWICHDTNVTKLPANWCPSHLDEVKNRAEWRVNGFKVDYCLSEEAPPVCKLHILLPVGWIVTCFNLLKAVLIFYTAFMIKDEPMMTIGDAVASFIERPDPRTKSSCLLSIKEVDHQPNLTPVGPKSWRANTSRWKDAMSKKRRITTIIISTITLIIISALLGSALRSIKLNGGQTNLQALIKMGFGSIDPRAIARWYLYGALANVFVANLGQTLLSCLYFAYNGLFTCMLLGFEWSQYAYERKGLRVSSARSGAQRSTYFLQLPYRYSLPLMGLSGLLHWLVSQSIFLVAIDSYEATGDGRLDDNFMSCGYSPIAILSVILLGSVMLLASVGFGYIPYKPGMSLVGSCSLAISAACHIEEWDLTDGYDVARARLQWGVVGERGDGVGHCAFSARDVKFPEEGKTYA